MTRTDDLVATLLLGEPLDESSDMSRAIGSFNITGVADAYARLSKDPARQVLGKPKVSVTFALSSSGLVDVSKAEAAIEMLEKYEDFDLQPVNETEANSTATPANEVPATDTAVDATATNDTINGIVNQTSMVKVKVEREQ